MCEALLKIFQGGELLLVHGFIHSFFQQALTKGLLYTKQQGIQIRSRDIIADSKKENPFQV